MACISSNSSFGRNNLDSVGLAHTSAPSAWNSRSFAIIHFCVTYIIWVILKKLSIAISWHINKQFYRWVLKSQTQTCRDLSTISDPNRRMSFVNTSVIFDSSPPLLNRMLLTNVPLLLPEKRAWKYCYLDNVLYKRPFPD